MRVLFDTQYQTWLCLYGWQASVLITSKPNAIQSVRFFIMDWRLRKSGVFRAVFLSAFLWLFSRIVVISRAEWYNSTRLAKHVENLVAAALCCNLFPYLLFECIIIWVRILTLMFLERASCVFGNFIFPSLQHSRLVVPTRPKGLFKCALWDKKLTLYKLRLKNCLVYCGNFLLIE
jgi:hypothetical protein